ncbi:MAG: hypothetical protein ACREE6_01350 [Limisphaerales bacterium]
MTLFLLVFAASSAYARMVVDLGETSDFVKITPDYSNAVVKAVLPYFSQAAEKLDLPVPTPITRRDIARIHIQPFRELSVSVIVKAGWTFQYMFGVVNRIANLRSYSVLQDPNKIPLFYGKVNMTKDEAVRMARDTLRKLDIPLEDVFAEQEPRVALPIKIGTNTVPHYEIQWLDPRINSQVIGQDNPQTEKTALVTMPAVDIQINGETKQIENLAISGKNLARPGPRIGVTPIPSPHWPSVNPEYARQLIPMMFKAIGDYARKLSLPVQLPLTTNNVARVRIYDNEGWPHAEITLTNGCRFIYRHTMVNGYYAPDNLFGSDRKIHIKDFEGKWNLTTNQAIAVVKDALRKLDYPTNHIHLNFAPFIFTASVDKEHIPRLEFQWYYSVQDDLQSRLEAEVNTENGKLESLYYDDKAYWGGRPPITVPISNGKYPAYPHG